MFNNNLARARMLGRVARAKSANACHVQRANAKVSRVNKAMPDLIVHDLRRYGKKKKITLKGVRMLKLVCFRRPNFTHPVLQMVPETGITRHN